jgi:hypothetical protein
MAKTAEKHTYETKPKSLPDWVCLWLKSNWKSFPLVFIETKEASSSLSGSSLAVKSTIVILSSARCIVPEYVSEPIVNWAGVASEEMPISVTVVPWRDNIELSRPADSDLPHHDDRPATQVNQNQIQGVGFSG